MSAIDELGMATERLRVRLPDEPKPKLLHIIEPHEVKDDLNGHAAVCLCPSVFEQFLKHVNYVYIAQYPKGLDDLYSLRSFTLFTQRGHNTAPKNPSVALLW